MIRRPWLPALGWLLGSLAAIAASGSARAAEFPTPFNTQPGPEQPPTPEQSVAGWKLPEGFDVTLFAGEPDVAQPIAMALDPRGRLWVVECYTYAEHLYDEELRDRIVILTDRDGDGRHDERTVFWDQGRKTTGVLPGRGGIFLLNDGCLQHLADRDGDDRPDGGPVTLLDGFEAHFVGHNIASGLIWGPDGWIWGRHGIQATSLVGPPGSAPEARTRLNCAIWRFHPERRLFEVVTSGTTNPWGLDYDRHGEFFFSNNVIGHLFHVIPGAHYQRMYGDDLNPHCYELLKEHADHYHWDTSGNWPDTGRSQSADSLGGGHSHCGLMIYQGDNWPEAYRGALLMCNTHGRRINHDAAERRGSGYVIRHRPDFGFAYGPWFRGVELRSGPDGGVYVSDWTDLGECHDHDGVHRTSGRIYKITYGTPKTAPKDLDLTRATNEELLAYQAHPDDWYARTARTVLADRFAGGTEDLSSVRTKATEAVRGTGNDTVHRLRSLWMLAAAGGVERDTLLALLEDGEPPLRIWAVRLLAEPSDVATPFVAPETARALKELARGDDDLSVRLALAAALPRLSPPERLALAATLAADPRIVDDHNLPLMIWYGAEAAVPVDPQGACAFADAATDPRLRTFVARRMASELKSRPELFDIAVTHAASRPPGEAGQWLTGINRALAGWATATPSAAWQAADAKLAAMDDQAVREQLRTLATLFGSGRAVDELKALAKDAKADSAARQEAVRLLVARRVDGLQPLLLTLADDRATQLEAIRGLGQFDTPAAGEKILKAFRRLDDQGQAIALATLAGRPAWAGRLLAGFEKGEIPRERMTATLARQLNDLGDGDVSAALARVWGSVRPTDEQRRAAIATWKTRLAAPAATTLDLGRGHVLFKARCATCHKLFGEGEAVAPDLTGGNRDSLDYLLENILDPSAIVPNPYRTTAFALEDGRTVTGVVTAENDQTVTIRTAEQSLTLTQDAIEERRTTDQSLMPDGLLEKLTEAEVADLIGYLRQAAPSLAPAK